MAPAQNQNNSWHLRKEFSYGVVLSTLSLAGLLIGQWVSLKSDMVLFQRHMQQIDNADLEDRIHSAEARIAGIEITDQALLTRMGENNTNHNKQFDLIQQEILRQLQDHSRKLERIEDRLNEHMTANHTEKKL